MLCATGAGGVHQYTWLLAGALEDQGVAVTLAVRDGYERLPAPGTSEFLALRKGHGAWSYPGDARLLLQAARRHDVVHLQAPLWSLPDSVLLLPALRRAAPLVAATMHEPLPYRRRWYHRAVYRRYYTLTQRVAVHSDEHRRILEELGARPAIVHTTPFGDHRAALGSPDPAFRPRSRLGLEGRSLVLFFGLLRPHKGLHDLIEALAGTEGTVSLLVAGQPLEPLEPYVTHARDAAVDLVLAEDYLGYLSGPQAAACLSDADVLVLPYRHGANSGVLSLAGAFSVPTVVTSAVAPAEYLARVPSEGVCPPGDVAALRAAVRRALDGGLAPPGRFPAWSEAAAAHLKLWSA
jgi:glycosyltransferase involved in cell wall biosynthesis